MPIKNKSVTGKSTGYLPGKLTGIPIMLLMLFIILWITITGANYPSALLSELFGKAESLLYSALSSIGTPGNAEQRSHRRDIQSACVGGIGNASSYGDILSAVHHT